MHERLGLAGFNHRNEILVLAFAVPGKAQTDKAPARFSPTTSKQRLKHKVSKELYACARHDTVPDDLLVYLPCLPFSTTQYARGALTVAGYRSSPRVVEQGRVRLQPRTENRH